MAAVPEVRYSTASGGHIAYQLFGEGPPLLVAAGPASNIDLLWQEPSSAAGLRRLGSFCRTVLFDRRGTGLSDGAAQPPTLEQQVDDALGVLETVGFEQTALWGATDAGLCAMLAATRPDLVTRLVLWGVAPAMSELLQGEVLQRFLDAITEGWGEGSLLGVYAPDREDDPSFRQWWIRFQRGSVPPGMARQLLEMFTALDLRAVLPAIRCPTLVMHREHDSLIPPELGEETARLIPGARFLTVPGRDNYGFDEEQLGMGVFEEFLTGERRSTSPDDRVLATVMLTDICGSTSELASRGDRAWQGLLAAHDRVAQDEVTAHRGRLLKSTGDGVLAVFDGPARAVRAAQALQRAWGELGLRTRIGLHTGECELVEGDAHGLAVHLAARVCEQAPAGTVLATSTVRDLVIGAGLRFTPHGEAELRGIPGSWSLLRVDAAT